MDDLSVASIHITKFYFHLQLFYVQDLFHLHDIYQKMFKMLRIIFEQLLIKESIERRSRILIKRLKDVEQ